MDKTATLWRMALAQLGLQGMEMDALYFPNLSLPSAAWTNPVALYFDKIGIIAPSEYEAALSDARTAELINVGLAEPMFLGAFEQGERDEELIEQLARWWRELPKGGRQPSPYKIHRGKLIHAGLIQLLSRHQLLREHPSDKAWLVGPEPVCMRIMSVLASRIMRAQSISALVTSQAAAFEVTTDREPRTDTKTERRAQAVTSLLPIAPWIPPADLRRFKDDHGAELRAFRGFVEQLIRRNDDDELFRSRLAGARDLRSHLVGELEAINARLARSGLGLAIAKLGGSLIEASPISGAIDFIAAISTRSEDARRRKEIERDEIAYAVLAQAELRARSSRELLA